MAISVISYATGNSNGWNNDIIVSKPSSVQNDDMLLAVIGCLGSQAGITSTGWTRFLEVDHGSPDRATNFYYKIITNAAGEPASYYWRHNDHAIMQGCIVNLRGVNITAPIIEHQGQSDSENITTASTPDVDFTYDNSLLLTALHIGKPGYPDLANPPTGWGSVTGNGSAPNPTLLFDVAANAEGYNWIKLGAAFYTLSTAGNNGGNFTWTVNGGSNFSEMGATLAIRPDSTTGGSCTCNAICDNDCAANNICTGHSPACSNSFTFTTITAGTIILASHLRELETAINLERVDSSRRSNETPPAYCSSDTGITACSTNDFSAYNFQGGLASDIVKADHFEDIKEANNEVYYESTYGALVTTAFKDQGTDPVNSVVKASDVTDLQTKINQTRNACICDSHCNCDPTDCGCNGECPSDDYYAYS